MKVDGSLTDNLAEIPTRARDLEAGGYDGAFTFEGPHDPFLPVLLAAEHTERLELSTAIAVAFARVVHGSRTCSRGCAARSRNFAPEIVTCSSARATGAR